MLGRVDCSCMVSKVRDKYDLPFMEPKNKNFASKALSYARWYQVEECSTLWSRVSLPTA